MRLDFKHGTLPLLHRGHAFRPSSDHTLANAELEVLATVSGRVEFGAVEQGANVVAFHPLAFGRRRFAFAFLDNLLQQRTVAAEINPSVGSTLGKGGFLLRFDGGGGGGLLLGCLGAHLCKHAAEHCLLLVGVPSDLCLHLFHRCDCTFVLAVNRQARLQVGLRFVPIAELEEGAAPAVQRFHRPRINLECGVALLFRCFQFVQLEVACCRVQIAREHCLVAGVVLVWRRDQLERCFVPPCRTCVVLLLEDGVALVFLRKHACG